MEEGELEIGQAASLLDDIPSAGQIVKKWAVNRAVWTVH